MLFDERNYPTGIATFDRWGEKVGGPDCLLSTICYKKSRNVGWSLEDRFYPGGRESPGIWARRSKVAILDAPLKLYPDTCRYVFL